MKPTCANSTSANAVVTGPRTPIAAQRSRADPLTPAHGATGAPSPPRQLGRNGGRPDREIRTTGNSTSMTITPAAISIAVGKAEAGRWSRTSAGTPAHAAEARAVQRQADRHAPPLLEPQAERVGDRAEAHAGPAEGQCGRSTSVELPRLRSTLTERDRWPTARREHVPAIEAEARAEPPAPPR